MRIILSTVFLIFSLISIGQTSVSGLVSDENGVPLPGANVVIDGTSTGVSTDFDGNFQIAVNQGDVLAISFIGYTTEFITFAGQSNMVGSDSRVRYIKNFPPFLGTENVQKNIKFSFSRTYRPTLGKN